jgi:hypothetical protein
LSTRPRFQCGMADNRTISQLEAEGYPWIGCECCKGTVWVPFRMLRERIPMLSARSGVWYASVDVIRWDTSRHTGRTDSFVHERCNSKKEAEEAARRLLAENAKYFNAESSVEARVVCELEWDAAASGDDDE